jgi:hypothetical protein
VNDVAPLEGEILAPERVGVTTLIKALRGTDPDGFVSFRVGELLALLNEITSAGYIRRNTSEQRQ